MLKKIWSSGYRKCEKWGDNKGESIQVDLCKLQSKHWLSSWMVGSQVFFIVLVYNR